VANRYAPQTAQKSAGQLITGALWNAGVGALINFMANVPSFRAYQTSVQAMASGSWTAMLFQGTSNDSDGGHSNVVNPSRYTCQVAGWYFVEGYVAINTGGSGARFDSAVAKNGTIVPASCQFLLRANDLQSLMCGTMVQLAVGDYVEIWGRQTSGVAINTFVGSDLLPVINGFWIHT
jgi:hypothetical protein